MKKKREDEREDERQDKIKSSRESEARQRWKEMKEVVFLFENPQTRQMNEPKMFRKKSSVGRIILPFFFESSESDRVFNYLYDSNSIFGSGELIQNGFRCARYCVLLGFSKTPNRTMHGNKDWDGWTHLQFSEILKESTVSRGNSSGILSQDTIRCSSMTKSNVCCWD